jgi:hypothetical protein
MIDTGQVLAEGTPLKVVIGLQKGRKAKYLRKQGNSNWHVISIGAGNDEYFVNLEEVEFDVPEKKKPKQLNLF